MDYIAESRTRILVTVRHTSNPIPPSSGRCHDIRSGHNSGALGNYFVPSAIWLGLLMLLLLKVRGRCTYPKHGRPWQAKVIAAQSVLSCAEVVYSES